MGSKPSSVEKRLRAEIDDELQKKSHKKKVAAAKPSLEDLGGATNSGAPAEKPGADEVEEPEGSSSEDVAGAGFWVANPEDDKKKEAKKDKKKKKKGSSSSSDSSSNSSSSSSVFRVTKKGNDRISQARLIQWAEDHPGKVALELLRKMQAVVGQDGEKVKKIGSAPAVAKQYDLRVLKAQSGAVTGAASRNQRELTTLCVILDHMALGRYKAAADVVAARLKSVEAGARTGNYEESSFLELVPVNPETLVTVDEQLLIKNESMLSPKRSSPHASTWMGHGKGNGNNSSYRWNPSGGGKNKKGGGKGKKNGKGKKGDKKD